MAFPGNAAITRVTEFGVERKPGNKRMKKCDREVTEMREVLCPNHMNVKGQGFTGKKWSGGGPGKQGRYLPYLWGPGHKECGRKDSL